MKIALLIWFPCSRFFYLVQTVLKGSQMATATLLQTGFVVQHWNCICYKFNCDVTFTKNFSMENFYQLLHAWSINVTSTNRTLLLRTACTCVTTCLIRLFYLNWHWNNFLFTAKDSLFSKYTLQCACTTRIWIQMLNRNANNVLYEPLWTFVCVLTLNFTEINCKIYYLLIWAHGVEWILPRFPWAWQNVEWPEKK